MNNTQTAIEWLKEKIKETYNKEGKLPLGYVLNLLSQAKAVEAEQMEDCWIAAHQAGRFEGKGIAQEDWQTFFNYYQETYGKKEKEER